MQTLGKSQGQQGFTLSALAPTAPTAGANPVLEEALRRAGLGEDSDLRKWRTRSRSASGAKPYPCPMP